MTDQPSPDHLEWSIEGRQKTQKTTLRLYVWIKKHPNKQAAYRHEIEYLTSVSFSLWRAVFLADRRLADKDFHMETFLAKMLTDNAITFAQDRSSRSWTFNYYATNARFWLEEVSRKWPQVGRALKPNGKPNTSRNRWDHLQNVYNLAVTLLEKETSRKKNSN
jgi:hypothetical protein